MTMRRILTLLLVGCFPWSVPHPAPQLRGQEPEDAKLKQLADDSRARAERVEVNVATGDRAIKAKVRPVPLIKYTDVPRHIEMATLWVWEDGGRPVAIGKVEAYHRPGTPRWLYCFTSASTGLVDAKWPTGQRFRATEPGIKWAALDGPTPAGTPAARLRQMKELFRHFSATTTDDVLKTSEELRPLARPLHEYSSPGHGVVQGVLCGFAANGTNPDVVVALEAVAPAGGKAGPTTWRYGVVGMTASGITVRLSKAEVYKRAYARNPKDSDAWTYFWEDAVKK
jgi:hypothetical protein